MQFSAVASVCTFSITLVAVWTITQGQIRSQAQGNQTLQEPVPVQTVPPRVVPEASPDNLRETNDVRVYRAVKDAIVNITSRHTITGRIRTGTGIDAVPWELLSPELRQRFTGQTQSQSLGSGFIIHPAGYVITNEHVIQQGTDIICNFVNGEKFPATVIASDTEHDLAVLKIKAEPDKRFVALPLGTAEDLMIGEPVYAIGNPFGFAGTMTRGIVSALNRTLEVSSERSYTGLIQTDASINPGNSGGPLLNAYGQVIGINSAIRADAQGIGFAITVSNMRDLLPAFLNPDALNHSQVGFNVEEVRSREGPSTIASAVLVKSVKSGSLAEEAGIRVGDKVLAINGNPVNTIIDALVPIAAATPGETLSLKLARLHTTAAPTLLNTSLVVAQPPPPPSPEDILKLKMGIRGQTVTAKLAAEKQLKIAQGIFVAIVDPDSTAARTGLKSGDIILQLGRYRVNSVEDLAILLKSVNQQVVVGIKILRGTDLGEGNIALQ
jgi:S1-C subfamily serine protease